ncbi:MAG: LutC/YkgG family protein, partial [Acidimicrobiales bacterium]
PVYLEDHPDLAGLAGLAEPAGALEPSGRRMTLATVTDPWEAAIGVTGVEVAVADTGTLALTSSPGRPRSTSVVPPVHVAMIPFSRLVATYTDALEHLDGLRPLPSNVNLVTGISRSSDIEMRPVLGVHGPGELHVVLYPDQ